MAYLLAFLQCFYSFLKYLVMKKMLFICMLIPTIFIFYSCGPSEIIVTTRPTPPVFVRPVPPASSYVWIEGNWVVRGGRYHWREGRWVRTGYGLAETGNQEEMAGIGAAAIGGKFLFIEISYPQGPLPFCKELLAYILQCVE